MTAATAWVDSNSNSQPTASASAVIRPGASQVGLPAMRRAARGGAQPARATDQSSVPRLIREVPTDGVPSVHGSLVDLGGDPL